jgi:glycosyltransferase involved in cell wall biosynthesis
LVPELAPHLEVIPNGVHPERYASGPVFAHPRPYIVAVGRLVPQKGFDVLIDAFAQLGVGLEVDLIIVGDGPDRESLIRGRAARGVDDRVHLLGARGAHEVAALLRGALLAVCPSRWEGLPVVCLEAMASARAVVATNVDGIPDAVVDGETGILVPPQNPRALAGVLSSLLADATTRERLGAAGRCRVREYFTWPTVASRYLGVLGAVARSPRGLAQP